MANEKRGELDIEINGNEYTIVLTIDVILKIQGILGHNILTFFHNSIMTTSAELWAKLVREGMKGAGADPLPSLKDLEKKYIMMGELNAVNALSSWLEPAIYGLDTGEEVDSEGK